MQVLKKSDFKSFKTLVRMNQTDLHKTLHRILISMYPKGSVVTTTNYTYAIGDIPICLVAHMDTVWEKPPIEIFYDKEANVIWSPQGLGADDRAGVFSIIKILATGLRPHVIFTQDEEIGCIGASILSSIPCPFKDCRFIIELDRAHQNDCVFYDCYNDEFEDFIEGYGFETHMGTFSDISELCPRWGIAGVNLSIGYRDEHTVAEVLFVKQMFKTIEKVKTILEDFDEETTPHFEYKNIWKVQECACYNCKKILPAHMIIPVVVDHLGEQAYFCGDCIVEKNVAWCHGCGEAVLPEVLSEDGLCPECEEEKNEAFLSGYSNPNFRNHRIQSRLYPREFDDDYDYE